MGQLIRDRDWSGTALGPIESWPESLNGLLDMVLCSAAPMALVWGLDLTILFNDAWRRFVRRSENQLGSPAATERTAPWPAILPTLVEVMSEGGSADVSGADGRAAFRLNPVFGGGNRPSGVVVRTSGAVAGKVEWLSFALDFGQLAIWDWDLTTDTVEWSPALYRLFGHEPGAITPSYELWSSSLHPADREEAVACLRTAQTTRATYESTHRIVRSDGAVRWCRSRGEPFVGLDGTPARFLGTVQDITEHREALENQKSLLAELQHRVRNNLAVVRSIIRRTAETSPDVEHFSSHIEGRIDALARVQGLLVRSPSGGIDLELLLREELLAAVAEDGEVEIEGPPLDLTPKAGETFSLAFNELTTNALKFGALRNREGKLAVRWSVIDGERDPVLDLSWIESGQHLAQPPRSSGFGMELLTRTLPYDYGARVSVEFPPDGFRCEIALPLTARVRRMNPTSPGAPRPHPTT